MFSRIFKKFFGPKEDKHSSNYPAEIQALLRLAKSGDPQAQFKMGYYFECKARNEEDLDKENEANTEAVKWYQQAKNHPVAQFRLGMCYIANKGVTSDEEKGEQLIGTVLPALLKAAHQRDADAQLSIGHCYQQGWGTDRDFKQAFVWFQKAASQGHAESQYMLAECYKMAAGVKEDYGQAILWYKKIIAQKPTVVPLERIKEKIIDLSSREAKKFKAPIVSSDITVNAVTDDKDAKEKKTDALMKSVESKTESLKEPVCIINIFAAANPAMSSTETHGKIVEEKLDQVREQQEITWCEVQYVRAAVEAKSNLSLLEEMKKLTALDFSSQTKAVATTNASTESATEVKKVAASAGDLDQQIVVLTPPKGIEHKEVPLTLTMLDALSKEITQLLKDKYSKQDTVPGLFSTRCHPLVDMNLTTAEQQVERFETQFSAQQRDEIGDYYKKSSKIRTSIAIETIFDEFTDDKGKEQKSPCRIQILGGSGVGNTTLCQLLSYSWSKGSKHSTASMLESIFPAEYEVKAFYSPLFDDTPKLKVEPKKTFYLDRFDFIFRISLVQFTQYETLAEAIYEQCCKQTSDTTEYKARLIQAINHILKTKKKSYLILLDDGDKINFSLDRKHIKKLLQEVFEAEYVILISNPCQQTELEQLNSKGFDRTLENIGFTDAQVEYYIQQYFAPIQNGKALAERLLTFLKNNLRILAAVHCPINLAILCSMFEGRTIKQTCKTDIYCEMTKYLFVQALLQKVKKEDRQEQEKELNRLPESWFYKKFEREMKLIERLAFRGLQNGRINLDAKLQGQVLSGVESEDRTISRKPLFVTALEIGFLRTIADPEAKNELEEKHYFVHLTIQEFFAARYLISCLKSRNTERLEEIRKFIERYKYTHSYQVVLGFVSGLASREESDEALTQFWNIILSKPLDLNNAGHWRLVIQCLEEASCDKRIPHLEKLLNMLIGYVEQVICCDESSVSCENFFFPSQIRKSSINSSSILLESFMFLFKYFPLVCERVRVMDVCIKLLNSTSPSRLNAIIVIEALGARMVTDEVVETLLRTALSDPEPIVNIHAIKVLLCFEEKRSIDKVIEALLRLLKTEDSYVSDLAINTLRNLREKAAIDKVIETLLRFLETKNNHVRSLVINALENLGKKAATDKVIKALLAMLPDIVLGEYIVEALEKMGAKAELHKIIKVLSRVVSGDSDAADNNIFEEIYKQAFEHGVFAPIISLLDVTEAESEAEVEAMRKRADKIRRRKCAFDMIQLLSNHVEVEIITDYLFKALLHSDSDVRSCAINVISKLKKPMLSTIVDFLFNALVDSDIDVKNRATNVIEQLAITLINDDDMTEAFLVFRDLAEKITDDVVNILVKILDENLNVSNLFIKLGEKATDKLIEVLASALAKALANNNSHFEYDLALRKLGKKAADKVIEVLEKILVYNDNEIIKKLVHSIRPPEEGGETDCDLDFLKTWGCKLEDDLELPSPLVSKAIVSSLEEKLDTDKLIESLVVKLVSSDDEERFNAYATLIELNENENIAKTVFFSILEKINQLSKDGSDIKNIKECLKIMCFPLPFLIKIYSEHNYDFMPGLIAYNVMGVIPIYITHTEKVALVHLPEQSVEPILVTLDQATAIAKSISSMLKLLGLCNDICKSYLSGKPLFHEHSSTIYMQSSGKPLLVTASEITLSDIVTLVQQRVNSKMMASSQEEKIPTTILPSHVQYRI